MTISVEELLGIVRVAYGIDVIKNDDGDQWICSGTFKDDKGEWMTLAVRGEEYQPTMVELLFTMAKWRQDGAIPDKVQFVSKGDHPIDSLAELCPDKEEIEEVA